MSPWIPHEHPDYRYPPSRNPYAQKIRDLPQTAFMDANTEHLQGKWRNTLNVEPTTPLILEIGCNGGHVLLEKATQNPNALFLGLDSKYKQIHHAATKAKKRNLSNIAFLRAQAQRLPYVFAPGEIDEVLLYFPDPWPKRAHQHHRLIQTSWLKRLAPLLKKDGKLHIKTDQSDYYHFILKNLEDCKESWSIESKNPDLHAEHPDPTRLEFPDVTLFEKIFIREKQPIHEIKVHRVA